MSVDDLTALKQSISQEISMSKVQLDTVLSTHNMLVEFVFQVVSTAKSLPTNEERLETLSNGMQEIKKYADQEIQKYTHNLGKLTGKLQGIELALKILSDDNQLQEKEDKEVTTAALDNSSMLEEND